MKDIETGEIITLDTYISIGYGKNERVYMDISTFNKEVKKVKENSLQNSDLEKFSLKEIYDNFVLLNYDERDHDDNILDEPSPIVLSKNSGGFKKTVEYFLKQEKIKIN